MSTKSIPLCECKSSKIHAHGFDPETGTLALQFKRSGKNGERVGGSIYHYKNFTQKQYDEFCKAESLGSYFGKHIKDKRDQFPFTKLEEEHDKPA